MPKGAALGAMLPTFTMSGSGWVTVELSSADSNAVALRTYLVLRDDHDADGSGAYRGHDVNGTGTDTRLTAVQLAPGRYTIEATTAVAGATGDYELVVTTLLADGFGPFF